MQIVFSAEEAAVAFHSTVPSVAVTTTLGNPGPSREHPRDAQPSSRSNAPRVPPADASGQQLAPGTSPNVALTVSDEPAYTQVVHDSSDSHAAQQSARLETFAPLPYFDDRVGATASVPARA